MVFLYWENKIDGDSIFYQLKVVPDAFPSIKLTEIIDSNDNYLRFFEGVIQDDYGFTSLTFNYRIVGEESKDWLTEELTINNNNQQGFYHHWNLSSVTLNTGESLEYFFEVWDNDAINGSKSSRSKTMVHKSPTKEEHEQQLEENNESLKTEIEDAMILAEEVQKEIEVVRATVTRRKRIELERQTKSTIVTRKSKETARKSS